MQTFEKYTISEMSYVFAKKLNITINGRKVKFIDFKFEDYTLEMMKIFPNGGYPSRFCAKLPHINKYICQDNLEQNTFVSNFKPSKYPQLPNNWIDFAQFSFEEGVDYLSIGHDYDNFSTWFITPNSDDLIIKNGDDAEFLHDDLEDAEGNYGTKFDYKGRADHKNKTVSMVAYGPVDKVRTQYIVSLLKFEWPKYSIFDFSSGLAKLIESIDIPIKPKDNIVYTGSDEPFTIFDISKIGTRTDAGFAGRGAYTTTDIKKAGRWGKYVMKTEIPSTARFLTISNLSELYNKYEMKRTTTEENNLPLNQRKSIYSKYMNEFTSRMLKMGYDGVKWNMSSGDVQYVLFEPEKYVFEPMNN